tara:strand:- start:600 stop:1085 length:486 start_codon:yes stop_codon:yes gene_type:complete
VLVILLLLFISVKDTTAQDGKTHEFLGNILIDGKKAKDVKVKFFDGNDCFLEYETKANGKFIFVGECEKYYTLQFEKEGYVTKRVIVKTFNTEELDYITKVYKFDVSLEEKKSYLDYSEHDFPIAIFEVDNDLKGFDFDKQYTSQRLEEMSLGSNMNMVNK